jgi:hypothetical protein
MKAVGLYLLFVVAYFFFAMASMKYDGLASIEQKFNPPTFVFWQGGELYSNPPLFSKFMADTRGQLSSREPDRIEDVDIWVFLLEGFEDVKNVVFASQIGIDVEKIATYEPGSSSKIQGASIRLRLHPVPVYVDRKQILLMDAKHLRENYKVECLDEMVYGSMIGHIDQELWDRCENA